MNEPQPDGATSPAAGLGRSARRSIIGDLVAGFALVVLIVFLFQPWYYSIHRLLAPAICRKVSLPACGLGFPVRADGPQVHSYLWVVLALAIIGLAVLVGRHASPPVPGDLTTSGRLLVGVSLVGLALSGLAVVSKPVAVPATPTAVVNHLITVGRLSTGWSHGGFVVIAATLVAVVGVYVAAAPGHEISGAARAVAAS
jgi:hypothetical protein